MTRGNVPYPTLEGYQVLDYLKRGNRMQKPETCPDQIYEIMLDCWQVNSRLRPPFREIVERIEAIIKNKENEMNIYSNLNVNYVNFEVDLYYAQNSKKLEQLEKLEKASSTYDSISTNYYNSSQSLGPKSPISPTAIYSTPSSMNNLTTSNLTANNLAAIKMSTFKSNEPPISTFKDLSPGGKVIEMPGKQQQVTLSAANKSKDISINEERTKLTGSLRGLPVNEEASPSHSRKSSNNSTTNLSIKLNRQNAIDLNEPDRTYSTEASHYEYVMQKPHILVDPHKSNKELNDLDAGDERSVDGELTLKNLDQANYLRPMKYFTNRN